MATRRTSDSRPAPRKSIPTDAVPAAATPTVESASPASVKTRKRRTAAQPQAVVAAIATPSVSADERRGMIAQSAYLRAERRGFSPEGQAEDWLAAEKEVDALLNSGHTAAQ